ncbi:amidohydrolase family protein [uncultured Litoreibacter sp.]|uniref:amidohydrolase family protein n=1 Tax=uncultured Litoreibacter sp. TaxID=1392394 RepID=UPI00263524E9|nr:amidohydrolase family protein [uncultured Litoreibacter sp.]
MTTQFAITDAHTHVFLPEKFTLAKERSYTPGSATVANLEEHLIRVGAKKVVIVQPSPHGVDNRPTLQALRELGHDKARGVCVVDPQAVSKDTMQSLWDSGVRGLRANLKTAGVNAAKDAERQLDTLSRAMKETDFILQVFLPVQVTIALRSTFENLGRPVILDHFGGLKTSSVTLASDVSGLLDVLSLPNVILKASGACRVRDYAVTSAALDKIAPELFAAARGRVIWGSDWPHTGKSSDRAQRHLSEIEPFMDVDDQASLDDIKKWSGNHKVFQDITRDTANALFGL